MAEHGPSMHDDLEAALGVQPAVVFWATGRWQRWIQCGPCPLRGPLRGKPRGCKSGTWYKAGSSEGVGREARAGSGHLGLGEISHWGSREGFLEVAFAWVVEAS